MAEGRWVEWLNQSALGFSCHRLSLFYKINTPLLFKAGRRWQAMAHGPPTICVS